MKHRLPIFSLVMLITVAIDNVRNLPVAAFFGKDLIFFLIISVIFFLIPVSYITSRLSSLESENGGIYYWVKKAFGDKAAFLAVWLQWVNTIIWYPTILSFISATASYIFSPELATNKSYLCICSIVVFWFLTAVGMLGLNVSVRFSELCAIFGMLFPMTILIIIGFFWIKSGNQTHLTIKELSSSPISNVGSWSSITVIITSFLGIELATSHIRNIKHSKGKFPTAILCSSVIICLTLVLGALTIAIVLPKEHINFVNGIMQVFIVFAECYKLHWLIPIMSVAVFFGSFGNTINWIISPIEGLLQSAENGHLPSFLTKTNRNNSPFFLLIAQGVIVTFMCCLFFFMPSINDFYWFFTNLSTQLYVFMYIMFFLSASVIESRVGLILIKKIPVYLICAVGCIGCLLTIVVGFIPPPGSIIENIFGYEVMYILVMLLSIMPVFFVLKRKTH